MEPLSRVLTTPVTSAEGDTNHSDLPLTVKGILDTIKTLQKENEDLKVSHWKAQTQLQSHVDWYRTAYEEAETKQNLSVQEVATRKQNYESAALQLYESQIQIQGYKNVLKQVQGELDNALEKLNESQERELKLNDEIKDLIKERDLASRAYFVTMTTLQDLRDSTTVRNEEIQSNEEQSLEHYDLTPTVEVNSDVTSNCLEENIPTDIPLSRNSPSTPEIENPEEVVVTGSDEMEVTDQVVNEQKNDTLPKNCSPVVDDWVVIDQCVDMRDNITEREPSVVSISEDGVTGQAVVSKISELDALAHDLLKFAMGYHLIGFKECAAEVTRYLAGTQEMDIHDDPIRLRIKLQSLVNQRELANLRDEIEGKSEVKKINGKDRKTLAEQEVLKVSSDPHVLAVEYHFRGYWDCVSDVAGYLKTPEGMDEIGDTGRIRLVSHLQRLGSVRKSANKQAAGGSPWSLNLLSANPPDALPTTDTYQSDHLNADNTGLSCIGEERSLTLTPKHMDKAKLMFLWARYPSTTVLKTYFPKIEFNQYVTARLEEWFSNFRIYFYEQLEEYARAGLSKGVGVKNFEDLLVSYETALYNSLDVYFNFNWTKHIEIPSSFHSVVELTLCEFFNAIQSGKDSEENWKEAIYTIVAKHDDTIPDYFKSDSTLESMISGKAQEKSFYNNQCKKPVTVGCRDQIKQKFGASWLYQWPKDNTNQNVLARSRRYESSDSSDDDDDSPPDMVTNERLEEPDSSDDDGPPEMITNQTENERLHSRRYEEPDSSDDEDVPDLVTNDIDVYDRLHARQFEDMDSSDDEGIPDLIAANTDDELHEPKSIENQKRPINNSCQDYPPDFQIYDMGFPMDDGNMGQYVYPRRIQELEVDKAVVYECLQYVYSSADMELKTDVADIFISDVGTSFQRLAELKDMCETALLASLTVENAVNSHDCGEKIKSDVIVDACVEKIIENKSQIWKTKEDYVEACQETPGLMYKLFMN